METDSYILVAEHQGSIRVSLTLSLQSAGYQVLAVDSLEASIDTLNQASGRCELLIIDFQLETMRCTQFASLLKHHLDEFPILLLVGTRCKKEIEKLNDLCELSTLQKPLDREQLLVTVERLLSKPEHTQHLKQSS